MVHCRAMTDRVVAPVARDVEFVLVRPARAVNVASAARALANMGFDRLTLVEAAADLPGDRAAAYGAWDILERARRAQGLEDAIADCGLVAGTSARRSDGAVSPRQLATLAATGGPGRLAVVFGPERTGLRVDELRLCHLQVRIPTSAGHSSLNLAQAVLVVAYELFLARAPSAAATPRAKRPSALTAAELESVLGHLEEGLRGVGYLAPRGSEAILAELRRFLARASPTAREAALLRGVARQIAWAGGEIERLRTARRRA